MPQTTSEQKRLAEERVSITAQARAILDTAKAESRSVTGEERAQVEQMFAQVDVLDKVLTTSVEKDAEDEIESRSEENSGKLNLPNSSARNGPAEDAELAQFLRGESRSVELSLTDARKTRGDRIQRRALSVGVSTAGGHLVEEGFRADLYDYKELLSGIRHTNPDVMMTAMGNDIPMPIVSSRGTAVLVGEAATITGEDPEFTRKIMKAYKYGHIVNLSFELLEDNGVGVEGWLAKDMARAMVRAQDNHFVNGSGVNQPEGILTTATVGVTGGTAVTTGTQQRPLGHPTADELIDLVHSVDFGYRMEPGLCYWLAHPDSLKAVRKFKGNDGQYIWQPSLIPGNPDTLLGFPIVVQPHVPEVGSGAKSFLFGSFNDAIVIRDVSMVRLERSMEHKFETDEISFRCLMRTDSRVRNAEAVKVFQGGTA